MIKYLLIVAVLLSCCAAPVAAQDQTWMVDSFFDIWTELSGTGSEPVRVNATGTAIIRTSQPLEPTGTYDTEMLSLSLSGSGGPFGTVKIRESPTLMSMGRYQVIDPETPLIDSFFDIFTEISFDGGQTWMQNQMSAHYSGTSDSFFDITYILEGDATHSDANGHVTVLKSASTMEMTQVVPEPGSLLALSAGICGLGGAFFRKRR